MNIYDKIVMVTDSELKCKYITDLIDRYNCFFEYVVSDGCGYCKFNNTDDVDNFYSDLCELKDKLFWLQCCYDKD